MKRYIKPTYEKDTIETVDIMSASGVSVEQDIQGSLTNAATSLDNLLSKVEQSIRD